MGPTLYLYEKALVARHHELQHEIEHKHLLAGLINRHPTLIQLSVARFGALLVALGTRLIQVEQPVEECCEPVVS